MTMTNTLEPAVDGLGLGAAEALGELSTSATGVDVGLAAAWPLPHAAPRTQPATARATIRAVLRLAGGRWDLAVLPDRGGRVASLRLDGAELLDQGIGVDQPTTEGFVDAGAWGWDELVPTVDPATWRGVELPDHGEAWRVPWQVESHSSSACEMSCAGRVLEWALERRISITDAVRAEYLLTNGGDTDLPGYWCSHVLFRYDTGMEVNVGARLKSFAAGKSWKFFVAPGSIDRARLRWRNGPDVEIAWDARVTPYCGVWICNGDLGGYRQVAIEPATGGGDRPDSDEPPPTLRPGESLSWWLEIRAL